MNKFIPILIIALVGCLLVSGCRSSRRMYQRPTDRGATALPGGDRDRHGCRASAGYTWSEARCGCIRLFEDGIRLNDRRNPDAAVSPFVVFAADSARAELFLPEGKRFLLKKKKNDWSGSGFVLNKNVQGKWAVADQKTGVVLFSE